jgi:hypothetical protein
MHIGRRGGKSRAVAVYASWLATSFVWRKIPGHGERQAQGLFNFIAGAINASCALRRMIIGQSAGRRMPR